MNIGSIHIPVKSLTNYDLAKYAKRLRIPHFRGVFMRDTLPASPRTRECGIVNLNTSHESGSHWVCYYIDERRRIYFDSFGQITPLEVQRYLKTEKEFASGAKVVQRSTDIVQAINSHICGHLCLFVLETLTDGATFQKVLDKLPHYGYTYNYW